MQKITVISIGNVSHFIITFNTRTTGDHPLAVNRLLIKYAVVKEQMTGWLCVAVELTTHSGLHCTGGVTVTLTAKYNDIVVGLLPRLPPRDDWHAIRVSQSVSQLARSPQLTRLAVTNYTSCHIRLPLSASESSSHEPMPPRRWRKCAVVIKRTRKINYYGLRWQIMRRIEFCHPTPCRRLSSRRSSRCHFF